MHFKRIDKFLQLGIFQNCKMRWKQMNRKHQIIFCVVGLVFLIVILGLLLHSCSKKEEKKVAKKTTSVERMVEIAKTTPKIESEPDPTEAIYTYLQGPKSWGRRIKWSGEWGVSYYDGGSFGGFGCGLCCVANIYSSLSEGKCTPVDAYRFAKKHTGYGGGGAIDWGFMKSALEQMGFSCELGKKPSSYEKFQQKVAQGQCDIVLVSSHNSKCYWKDTPGHYVTIFLYDREKDCVFLGDSGDPNHNRHWISLKKIYKSLKTASAYQYLQVNAYTKEQNTWKHKKAKGNWVSE